MSSALDSNDRQQQKAQTFFQHGNDAASKGNFDYAIQMFKEACKIQPESIPFRQAIRNVVRRKFDNDPAKVGFMAAARAKPVKFLIKKAKAQSQWGHVLEVCEEAFLHNPWDTASSRDAAEAAEHLGFLELAQWYLESVQAQAKDAEFFRQMAHVYKINENFQKAIQCWERVKKLDPNDDSAHRQINALSASATIARSGLDEALSKRAAGSQGLDTFAPEVEDPAHAALSPEERLLKDIRETPQRVGAYLHLADYYREKNRLEEAERILARGLKAIPGDVTLQHTHAEVQIARLKSAQEAWSKKCLKHPEDVSAKANLDKVQAMLNEYEVTEFRRRLALHPDDQKLQYELGVRLAQSGQHDKAIELFQKARSNPSLKVEALHQLGLSFEAKGILPLAERNFADALKDADPTDLTLVNALRYRLGRVAEALGNTQQALEHYTEVAANDYAYLDVAQRLQNLN